MYIGSKEYSREELLRRTGDTGVLYGARLMTLRDGFSDGLRVIDVRTTAGLRLLLSESQCLDILELSFKGNNIGFTTANGFSANTYARPTSDFHEFKRFWPGNMLYTCGLRNTGASNLCGDEDFAVHDSIGLTPATKVGIDIDDRGVIQITGTMLESSIDYCLELKRTFHIPGDGSKISVRDRVRNLRHNPEWVFLLYHINFGFPFVGEDLFLEWPRGSVEPRDDHSAKFMDSYGKIATPVDNAKEQYFIHHADDNRAHAAFYNPQLGIGARICYDTSELPFLVEWKGVGSSHYSLGVELSTSRIRGRKEELEDGYKTAVGAFGELQFGFDLELSTTQILE